MFVYSKPNFQINQNVFLFFKNIINFLVSLIPLYICYYNKVLYSYALSSKFFQLFLVIMPFTTMAR